MAQDDASSIRTRPSLLRKLRSGEDDESWNEFYLVYGKLVRGFAVQAGLNEDEADEVLQETAIALSRKLPAFEYDPAVCRFKTWLLNQTSWRIKDQLRKRAKSGRACSPSEAANSNSSCAEDATRTDTVHRMADPSSIDLDALFEMEWQRNLLAVALGRVKNNFTHKQFQTFDLLVFKEWPAADVARLLGVSIANVYVTKHRISTAIKKETARLLKQMERHIGGLAQPD